MSPAEPTVVPGAVAEIGLDKDAVRRRVETDFGTAHAPFRIKVFGLGGNGSDYFHLATIPGKYSCRATLRAEFDAAVRGERHCTPEFLRRGGCGQRSRSQQTGK